MLKESPVIDKIIPATAAIKQKLSEIEQAVRCNPNTDANIFIKNSTVLRELVSFPWHNKLIEVISWLHNKLPGCILLTSGHRTNSQIHNTNPLRAVDLRSSVFSEPFKVRDYINENWIYGDGVRNVCLFHRVIICKNCKNKQEADPTKSLYGIKCVKCSNSNFEDWGPHFHIQVSDRTKTNG